MPKRLPIVNLIGLIKNFYLTHQRMPSFSELAEICNYKSKGAVQYLIQQLVKLRVVSQDETGRLLPGRVLQAYPVLGSVQAGFPSPAEEHLLDTISFDEYLIDNPAATFLVRVQGDSMIEAGIMPNDLVIVNRSKQAGEGDIVIAKVDDGWTMKYLEKQHGKYVLRPANKKYPLIVPNQELNIEGVITGVVRKC